MICDKSSGPCVKSKMTISIYASFQYLQQSVNNTAWCLSFVTLGYLYVLYVYLFCISQRSMTFQINLQEMRYMTALIWLVKLSIIQRGHWLWKCSFRGNYGDFILTQRYSLISRTYLLQLISEDCLYYRNIYMLYIYFVPFSDMQERQSWKTHMETNKVLMQNQFLSHHCMFSRLWIHHTNYTLMCVSGEREIMFISL